MSVCHSYGPFSVNTAALHCVHRYCHLLMVSASSGGISWSNWQTVFVRMVCDSASGKEISHFHWICNDLLMENPIFPPNPYERMVEIELEYLCNYPL